MTCKGYKVVYRDMDGTLKSTVSCTYTRYAVGEWARPKAADGPLAVFDNLGNALHYAGPKWEVYECEYIPSQSQQLWHWGFYGRYEALCILPPGTQFANAVKLLKKVY